MNFESKIVCIVLAVFLLSGSSIFSQTPANQKQSYTKVLVKSKNQESLSINRANYTQRVEAKTQIQRPNPVNKTGSLNTNSTKNNSSKSTLSIVIGENSNPPTPEQIRAKELKEYNYRNNNPIKPKPVKGTADSF